MLTRFLQHRPILRDRLSALAVFTGIALGGVSGIEMVIGAGFDPITPSFAYQAEEPRTWFDRPVAADMGWTTEAYDIHTAALPVRLEPDEGQTVEHLSYEEWSAPIESLDGAPAPSEPRIVFIEAPITAPYGETAPSNEDVAIKTYEDEMAAVEGMIAQALDDESYNSVPLTASGTASPS